MKNPACIFYLVLVVYFTGQWKASNVGGGGGKIVDLLSLLASLFECNKAKKLMPKSSPADTKHLHYQDPPIAPSRGNMHVDWDLVTQTELKGISERQGSQRCSV